MAPEEPSVFVAPAGVADVRLTCGNPGGQASRPDALVAGLEEKGPLCGG